MSLILTSTFSDLNDYLRSIDADGDTSVEEVLGIRKNSDDDVASLSAEVNELIDLGPFQKSADDLFQAIQSVARQARRTHLPDEGCEALKEAVERQLGYVIAGYQITVQKLPVKAKEGAAP